MTKAVNEETDKPTISRNEAHKDTRRSMGLPDHQRSLMTKEGTTHQQKCTRRQRQNMHVGRESSTDKKRSVHNKPISGGE